MLSSAAPSFPRGAVLINGAGQAIYLPAVAGVVNAGNGQWRVELSGCTNPVRWSEGTRVYPASSVSLSIDGSTLMLGLDDAPPQPVARLSGFALRYIFASGGSEEVLSTYDGPSVVGADGSLKTLSALGLYAEASGEGVNRAFTERLPLSRGGPPVREVQVCGGNASMVGVGVVAVEIRRAPRGAVTLLANGWSRAVATTTVFPNVPVGPLTATIDEVWDGDALYRVNDQSSYTQTYQVDGYNVTRVVADYQPVPGTLEVEIQGLPQGAQVPVDLGNGSQTQPLGNGLHRIDLNPGGYQLRFLPYENRFSPDPSEASVRVRSLQNVRVSVRYEPNPYRLVLNVRLLEGGTTGLAPKVCVVPRDTIQGSIDPNAELSNCPLR